MNLNTDALHLELTFGDDNHLLLMLRKRLSNEEVEYLKNVFTLVLESIVDSEPPADAEDDRAANEGRDASRRRRRG